jgi:hypothetical protein
MQTSRRLGRLGQLVRVACPLAMLLGTVGCASEQRYIYRPEENATARVAGRPAAYYVVPAQEPRGDVRVATLGIAMLEPRGGGHRLHAMHVRLVVDNNDDTGPWQVDTREQWGTLDNYGQSRPAFSAATRGRPPILQIPPGTSDTIDLYYPLPSSMQDASELPHFEVLWRVQTPETLVSERTSFERLRVEPAPSPAYYGPGYGMEWAGPPWYGWYDPFWPGFAFTGAPLVYYYARPAVLGAPRPPPPARPIR